MEYLTNIGPKKSTQRSLQGSRGGAFSICLSWLFSFTVYAFLSIISDWTHIHVFFNFILRRLFLGIFICAKITFITLDIFLNNYGGWWNRVIVCAKTKIMFLCSWLLRLPLGLLWYMQVPWSVLVCRYLGLFWYVHIPRGLFWDVQEYYAFFLSTNSFFLWGLVKLWILNFVAQFAYTFDCNYCGSYTYSKVPFL